MARSRPKPTPPPPPAVEPTEAVPDAGVDPEAEPQADDRGVFPDEDMPAARIDERVELPSPAAGAAGGPRMPEPPAYDNRMPPLQPMPAPSAPPPYDPQAGAQPDAYVDGDGQMYRSEPPEQPRRDGDPAREASNATAGRETDILVNAFVDYEDDEHGGQMVSCGLLSRITMSRAVMPETYVPGWVGGNTFWIRMYHATAIMGQLGRGIGQPFVYRPNTGRPFVRGWRVDMNIDEVIAQKLAAAGIVVPPGTTIGQAPGSIPIPYAQGQVGYFQTQMDQMQRRLDAAEDRARKAEDRVDRERELQPIRDQMQRIEQKLNNGGGNGGGNTVEAFKAMADVLRGKEDSADKAEERKLRFYDLKHGPQATATQFAMMSSMVDLQQKLLTTMGKKEGIDVEKIGDKLTAFMTMQSVQRREDMKFKEELIDIREKRGERKDELKLREKENQTRVGRNIDAMLQSLVDAIRDREPPEKVAKMFDLFKETAVEFHWADFDKGTTELLHDIKTFPEIPIAGVFGPKAGIVPPVADKDGYYLLEIGRHLRVAYGLGPFDPRLYKQRIDAEERGRQPPQPAAPAAPSPAAAVAPAAPPAAAPVATGAGQAGPDTPPAATAAPAASQGAAPAPAPEAKPLDPQIAVPKPAAQ